MPKSWAVFVNVEHHVKQRSKFGSVSDHSDQVISSIWITSFVWREVWEIVRVGFCSAQLSSQLSIKHSKKCTTHLSNPIVLISGINWINHFVFRVKSLNSKVWSYRRTCIFERDSSMVHKSIENLSWKYSGNHLPNLPWILKGLPVKIVGKYVDDTPMFN